MKLVTKKCAMSNTMRQTSVRVLAHCLRLRKDGGGVWMIQSKTLLTEGSIWRKLVAFALPLFLGQSVSAALQYGGLADRRESAWEQCPGGGQLVRQPDFSAGRIF